VLGAAFALRISLDEQALAEDAASSRDAAHLPVVTAEHESQPTQRTQPKGIDPKTGKPYEPIEILVPQEREIEDLLSRAAGRSAGDRPQE
jgi:hypothetical protein